MTSPARLWRTLRHLKLRQFTGRLAFRLARPRPRTGPPPAQRTWSGPWVQPAARAPSLISPTCLRLLNVEGDIDALGWCGPGAEKLWRYNQHYFDDLNALDAGQRRNWHDMLVQRWMAQNPPGAGDGWEPYPASLRIVNWIKAAASGWPMPDGAWHSLAVQARWLTQRLEWHLLGNHLFANAKALVFAGLAFEGPEAEGWLQQGLKILAEQLPEQVLSDGGQFERSPMYHALALEDVLDLINAARAAAVPALEGDSAAWQQVAGKMLSWLRLMTHPDGKLARFNDSADGIAPANAELERYAAGLGVAAEASALGMVGAAFAQDGLIHLADSGYVRVVRGPAVAILDLAPVGPDYLPGHAHADTLSFELSVHGCLLVVNGGTSCYGTSPRRLHERGTAAHSTVEVAGHNSSEVWSGFRVGRRARVHDIQVAADRVSACHDGYAWLQSRPMHRRAWHFGDDGLVVDDEVSTPSLPAVARYHLGPGVTALQTDVTAVDGSRWELRAEARVVAIVDVVRGDAVVEPSTFAPQFGVVLSTQCLAVRCMDGKASTRWRWQ